MNPNPTPLMAVTAEALSLLSDLATKHPELPAPYLTISTHSSDLHHEYAVSHDLPSIPHQQDRRAS